MHPPSATQRRELPLVDLDAERSFVAAAVWDYGKFAGMALDEECFTSPLHRRVLDAAREAWELGNTGPAHVLDVFQRKGVQNANHALADLIEHEVDPQLTVPPERLRELAKLRAVREGAQRALIAVENEDAGRAQTELDKANAALKKLTEPPAPKYLTLAEMAAQCLRPVGQRFPTGFPSLDEATRGGLMLGRVVVFAGPPGSAKTGLATQLADDLERRGCAVVFLAADEQPSAILTRLAQRAGFSREGVESEGAIGDSVRAGFAERSKGRSIVVIDPDASDSMRTIEDAAAALEHLAGHRPRVLVVDSLQTAQCRAAELADSQRERTDAKLAVCKAIAKRGDLVIIISEMARGGYRTGDRHSDVSALAAGKESGGIEYSAGLLLGLRPVKGENGLIDVEVAKNRLGGAKPEFRLRLDFDRARFAEVAMPDREEERQTQVDMKASKARERVAQAVLRDTCLKSKDAICRAVGANRSETWRAVTEMLETGELQQVDGFYRLARGGSNG